MRMKVPKFSKEYCVDFPKLDGGLNLRDLGYLMNNNESPFVKNLMWRDGLLQSRWGQRKVAETSISFDQSQFHIKYAVSERPFHGYTFFHIGDTIQCLETETPLQEPEGDPPVYTRCNVLGNGIATNRGTFFQYHGRLYYKNRGGFYQITHVPGGGTTGGAVSGKYEVFWSSQAIGTPTYSIFKLSGNRYTKITSLSDIPISDATNLQERYIIRENSVAVSVSDVDRGFLLAAKAMPKSTDAGYSNSYVLMDADAVDSGGITNDYVLAISRPGGAGAENKIRMYPVGYDHIGNLVAQTNSCIGVGPGGGKLRYIDDSDVHSAWLLQTPGTAGNFTLVNLGVAREDPERYASSKPLLYYRPEAVLNQAPFTLENMMDVADDPANAPVIVINADPSTGSGDMYQPENRLGYTKTVWYNAVTDVADYYLPVRNAWLVQVTVNDVVQVEDTDFTYTHGIGRIRFTNAPDPGTPPANNTVKITYYKANTDARYAVIDCPYATVASGGDSAQYIVLGGCDQQPDAIFWNANDELAIQPWYFPIPCYNFMGTAGDMVTGFGKQYDDTLVFSDRATGKLAYSIQSVNGRDYPSFGYVRVNDKIGCDLPWTIQQIQNNVVFCNSYTGAHIVLSSSAAYENNIQCISDKINELGNDENTGSGVEDVGPGGLLADIHDSSVDTLSFDDGSRYWLIISGKVYVWDYDISTYAKPSWFFWNRIPSRGVFFDARNNVYHMDRFGNVLAFKACNNDFYMDTSDETPTPGYRSIPKVYRFPTQLLGGFTHLKDITQLLIALRDDVPSTVRLYYCAENEARADLTDMSTAHSASRNPVARRFVKVFRRTPGCRNIRQFSLTLSNNTINQDLAPVYLQIYYRYTGKER